MLNATYEPLCVVPVRRAVVLVLKEKAEVLRGWMREGRIVDTDPVAVECTVYARAEDHSIVGEKTVTVPADEDENVRVPVSLETERRAVTGILRMCQSLD